MHHTNPTIPPCRVPLAVAGSRRIERCYAMLGKGGSELPLRSARIELVLVDDARDVWNVLGVRAEPARFASDAVDRDAGWRVLGWRMADGTRPLGDYDVVDPDLAQLERLPFPDPLPGVTSSSDGGWGDPT
ncbi:hypothetical protein [Dokdonella sp.]|uniref:hypothetical protein n=1 Tax=Dokdonella sp. TaxID=2291710 RepID=UPI002F41365B